MPTTIDFAPSTGDAQGFATPGINTLHNRAAFRIPMPLASAMLSTGAAIHFGTAVTDYGSFELLSLF